jgi:hypothetical protein
MPETRVERRSFPRPPLWLNLLLLLLGIAGILVARQHRDRVAKRFAGVIAEEQRTPVDVNKIKQDLAEMDLTRDALQKELDGRMKFVNSLKTEDFLISVDTSKRKIRFLYGDTVLREENVTIGESRTIESGGKRWTFAPLKGAFPVQAKLVGYEWPVPEWMYGMTNQPPPVTAEVVPNGLGRYVVVLGNGYVIHSTPSESSPLKGPKPGSFMVSDDFLAAIWARIARNKTQVYIY